MWGVGSSLSCTTLVGRHDSCRPNLDAWRARRRLTAEICRPTFMQRAAAGPSESIGTGSGRYGRSSCTAARGRAGFLDPAARYFTTSPNGPRSAGRGSPPPSWDRSATDSRPAAVKAGPRAEMSPARAAWLPSCRTQAEDLTGARGRPQTCRRHALDGGYLQWIIASSLRRGGDYSAHAGLERNANSLTRHVEDF